MMWPRRAWARAARGPAATPRTAPLPRRNRRRLRRGFSMAGCYTLARPESVESLPVELDAVTGAIGRQRRARLQAQRLGDEPIEPEAVRLEVGTIRRRRQQVDGDVVRAVRRDRKTEGLGQVADFHERGDAAAVRDVGLGERHAA